MSESSHSRRFGGLCRMSALPPIATKERTSIYIGEGHKQSWPLTRGYSGKDGASHANEMERAANAGANGPVVVNPPRPLSEPPTVEHALGVIPAADVAVFRRCPVVLREACLVRAIFVISLEY